LTALAQSGLIYGGVDFLMLLRLLDEAT